jgi:dTDP-4-dehydrorhamnose 3,5-epimerase
MILSETPLRGSFLIQPQPHFDERGFFSRYYCQSEFQRSGLNTEWPQINNSFSTQPGTLRGLHYQRPPNAEVKLVRCVRGEIWDVIVDLRAESQTYGRWFGSTLTQENRHMMYVPKGFAHGFISLTSNVELIYMVSNKYTPESEETLLWSDKDVDIGWPANPSVISSKDQQGRSLHSLSPMTIQ